VTVTTALPTATPVTSPLAFTVATAGLLDAYVTVAVGAPTGRVVVTANDVVALRATDTGLGVALTAEIPGCGLDTVTAMSCVIDVAANPLPPGLDAVTVMVALPTPTAVTRPEAFTVATAADDEAYDTDADGAPTGCCAVAVTCCVAPTSAEMLEGDAASEVMPGGADVTVIGTFRGTDAALKLAEPAAVAVTTIVALPTDTAVTTPDALTVAIPGAVDA
jgi:hypothetical protein